MADTYLDMSEHYIMSISQGLDNSQHKLLPLYLHIGH
jgi:hypothetical protein